MEAILPHFWVRPFCVVVWSSLWNQRSRVQISELTQHFSCCYPYTEHNHFLSEFHKFFLYFRDFVTMAINTKNLMKDPNPN